MSEGYKLVFRGEVLEGQHAAVVRKRLAAVAGFGAEQLDVLFSGRAVVLKRQVDAATAARLQGLFKDAGARLRVLPMAAAAEAAADTTAESIESPGDLQLLPSGSPVLRDDERQRWEPREIDTDALSLAEAGTALAPITAPFIPAIDLDARDFDLAPAGASLGPAQAPSQAQPPDTSHLKLELPD
ncbi:MAG: hypothetical protein ACNA7W_14825 [Pseudomonadales bacterium]